MQRACAINPKHKHTEILNDHQHDLLNFQTVFNLIIMKLKQFLSALLVNLTIAFVLAFIFGFNPVTCAGVVLAIGAIQYKVNRQTGIALFVGLAQEIWLPDVMDLFYPDSSFLSQPTDLSSLVNMDVINMADAGADPTVLVDNTVYPIAEADAGDNALALTLKTYDTTSSVVRNAVALELAYDQRQLYTNKHKKALLQKFGVDAAYAYAPAAASAVNPIVDGTADAAGVILDRIIDLQTQFNTMDAPVDGRTLILDPNHAAIIAKEDKLLYKSFESTPGAMLFGFKIYMFSKNPIYVKSGLTKAALGTAYVGATHGRSSVAFLNSEVMKAQGTFKLFSVLNDPSRKGDVFNFQMRGLAKSIRSKYMGAIVK
jgi:hypothetical protein